MATKTVEPTPEPPKPPKNPGEATYTLRPKKEEGKKDG